VKEKGSFMARIPGEKQPAAHYDCSDCLAFCCSVYDVVEVTDRDLRRLDLRIAAGGMSRLPRTVALLLLRSA
jgi:hypothetical protein